MNESKFICPYCNNDDQRLLELVMTYKGQRIFCNNCSKMSEPTERKNNDDKTGS